MVFSPFTTEIQPSQDITKVAITGDGVKPHGVPASVPVAFNIDTRQSGDAPLEVEVKVWDVKLKETISELRTEGISE